MRKKAKRKESAVHLRCRRHCGSESRSKCVKQHYMHGCYHARLEVCQKSWPSRKRSDSKCSAQVIPSLQLIPSTFAFEQHIVRGGAATWA